MRPRCFDCLTEDVTVKVIDQCGFEKWFCAEDWNWNQRAYDALMKFLADATGHLETQA